MSELVTRIGSCELPDGPPGEVRGHWVRSTVAEYQAAIDAHGGSEGPVGVVEPRRTSTVNTARRSCSPAGAPATNPSAVAACGGPPGREDRVSGEYAGCP